MQDMINLQVNGDNHTISAPASVKGLLEILGLRQDRLAVEVNRRIVRKAAWPDTLLQDGDRVEIVQFVGGG